MTFSVYKTTSFYVSSTNNWNLRSHNNKSHLVFKVACPTTEITPSLKLKVAPTKSVASNRIGKRFLQNIRKV